MSNKVASQRDRFYQWYNVPADVQKLTRSETVESNGTAGTTSFSEGRTRTRHDFNYGSQKSDRRLSGRKEYSSVGREERDRERCRSEKNRAVEFDVFDPV